MAAHTDPMPDRSISSSGRASPANLRLQLNNGDGPIKKDKIYRRWTANIERVLATFDQVDEWADYISFLSRLQKALQSGPPDENDFPLKASIGKRLAQCLTPSLPSGVHQKALDVYNYIFQALGVEGLSRDLSLYLPGLAPLISFASLSVKPLILDIFEKHIVKLHFDAIRPALKSLMLSLLPALEEETSEDFERASSILAALKNSSRNPLHSPNPSIVTRNDAFFWHCLFLASITSPSRRSGALAYLSRNLPDLNIQSTQNQGTSGPYVERQSDNDEASAVAMPEPGLLIRCFCTGLQDEQILVQRGFLDLLCEKLPLNSFVLQTKARKEDVQRLVMSATLVLLRRDMSLNRRLWTWFLGSASSGESNDTSVAKSPLTPTKIPVATPTTAQERARETEYFQRFGVSELVSGICQQLTIGKDSSEIITRNLRICLALMDRWEIGNAVTPLIFQPAVKCIFRYTASDNSKVLRNEVSRSGSMFFDSVESAIIWSEALKLIKEAFRSFEDFLLNENLPTIGNILAKFNVREEDMQKFHLPLIAAYLFASICKIIPQENEKWERQDLRLGQALRVGTALLQHIPPTAFDTPSSTEAGYEPLIEIDELIEAVEVFYLKTHKSGEVENYVQKFAIITGSYVSRILVFILAHEQTLTYDTIETSVLLFDVVLRKSPSIVLPADRLLGQLKMLPSNHTAEEKQHFSIARTLTRVSILEILHSSLHRSSVLERKNLRIMIPCLIESAWLGLSPAEPRYRVEATNAIWRINSICDGDDLVESCIAAICTRALSNSSGDSSEALEFCRRFAIFWQQSQTQAEVSRSRNASAARGLDQNASAKRYQLWSRPLLLILEQLLEADNEISIFISHWLGHLPELPTVINIVFTHIVTSTATLTESQPESQSDLHQDYNDFIDLKHCAFLFKILLKVFQLGKPMLDTILSKHIGDETKQSLLTKLEVICDTCIKLQTSRNDILKEDQEISSQLRHTSLILFDFILPLMAPENILQREFDLILMNELKRCLMQRDYIRQVDLTSITATAVVIRATAHSLVNEPQRKDASTGFKDSRHVNAAAEKHDLIQAAESSFVVPPIVLECIIKAMQDEIYNPFIDSWLHLLDRVLPLYGNRIFAILSPLGQCFSDMLRRLLNHLKISFGIAKEDVPAVDEAQIIHVLNAFERILELGHGTLAEQISLSEDPDQTQHTSGFFNMVSSLASDAEKPKAPSESDRTAVLISFKDAIKVCFEIWSFDEFSVNRKSEDVTSFSSMKYITIRLRNRTRRISEHLFQAQDLECLEALVLLWHNFMLDGNQVACGKILGFLSTIEAARPKVTIPAIFNAIYSRTHPTALDPERCSSLTTELHEALFTEFLNTYIRSLEDDAMDEIWSNCLTFLRDVLTSPLNHRQILVQLLQFVVELGTKIDKTNFGEQRKMRKELGDLFIRLLSAITTIKPSGIRHENQRSGDKDLRGSDQALIRYQNLTNMHSADLVEILASVYPRLSPTLLEHDRMGAVSTQISTQVIGPLLRSKFFPRNIQDTLISLITAIGLVQEASKPYKKDVGDAFGDPRFFSTDTKDAKLWLPVIRQWAVGDKERLPDLYTRLVPPTAAGLMFGVGASSARIEADRKTQLILRRMATILIAGPADGFVVNLPGLLGKLAELLHANSTSSPSSATRGDVYITFRAIALRISPSHLSGLWPILDSEFSRAISLMLSNTKGDQLSPEISLQLCKLIDTLLLLNFDEFQIHEWLLITDNSDAMYGLGPSGSVALADSAAEIMGASTHDTMPVQVDESLKPGWRRPLLTHSTVSTTPVEEYMEKIVRPFLNQLSIRSFEAVYDLKEPDLEACEHELIEDLFNESTLA